MKLKKHIPFYLLLLVALVFQPAWVNSAPPRQEETNGPFVSEAVEPLSSMEAGLLPAVDESSLQIVDRAPINPLQNEPDQGQRGTWDRTNVPIDPLIQPEGGQESISSEATPALLLNKAGVGNPTGCGTCTPPHSNGDVGPSHYVQAVNQTKIAIYNKSGTLIAAPFSLGSLWSSGNCTGNAGEPIVLYDQMAGRWVLSQFADPTHMCFAISKSADPTLDYWLYEFNVGYFPDYFKLGVWPDGYYMSANEITYTAYAFERTKMLAGQAATFQKFSGGTNFFMPSDLDGATKPPTGAPNYFYTFKDNSTHGGIDRIDIYEFKVNWTTPASSTFALKKSISIAPFTYTVCGFFNLNCIKQLGTAQRLSAASEWPMFRFPYRNFGARQSLVGTFTVGGGLGEVGAAVRWFELRNTGAGWTLYQQGTVSVNDGKDRFMPSIAMDGFGNIALGYSVSSSTMYPSIRYTVHRVGDALGTMQPEATLIAGTGSQTGSNLWGSYSSMSVDPADNVSFWYTNEYYSANSPNQWKTRFGKFKIMQSLTLKSVGLYDGHIIESGENTGVGGSLSSTATTLRLGDDISKRQYRAILQFNASTLPDTAIISQAVLKVKKQGMGSTNPFNLLGGLLVDVKKPYFGTALGLQAADFQAAAGLGTVGTFGVTPVNNWYSASINATGRTYISRTGTTQFRLRFATDDNNNSIADYMTFFSGNATSAADFPVLFLQYYVP